MDHVWESDQETFVKKLENILDIMIQWYNIYIDYFRYKKNFKNTEHKNITEKHTKKTTCSPRTMLMILLYLPSLFFCSWMFARKSFHIMII